MVVSGGMPTGASGVISGGVRDFGETWRCQVMDAAADRLGWEFAGRLN